MAESSQTYADHMSEDGVSNSHSQPTSYKLNVWGAIVIIAALAFGTSIIWMILSAGKEVLGILMALGINYFMWRF